MYTGVFRPPSASYTLRILRNTRLVLVDSEGQTYGWDIKRLCEKVRGKQPGSAGKRRAQADRRDYINRTVKQLPWDRLQLLAVEELKNLKKVGCYPFIGPREMGLAYFTDRILRVSLWAAGRAALGRIPR